MQPRSTRLAYSTSRPPKRCAARASARTHGRRAHGRCAGTGVYRNTAPDDGAEQSLECRGGRRPCGCVDPRRDDLPLTRCPPASADLVEELFRCRADSPEPSCLHNGQSRIGDIPEVRRDLMPRDVVLHLRTAHARPTLRIAELEVQDVRDLRGKVLDVDVPVAIVGSAEEQLRVVVEKHEPHVVDGADPVYQLIANAV